MTPSKLCTSCLPCCQSFTVQDYINKTLVTDAHVTAEFPYPRCGDREGESCPNDDCTSSGIPCGPWPQLYIPVTDGGYLLHDGNLFEASETPPISSNICPSEGVKIVQTEKQFHGRLGFDFCGDDECESIETKYLTMALDFSYAQVDSVDPADDYEGDFSVTRSVNRYSGEVTESDCSNTGVAGSSFSESDVKRLVQILSSIRYACGEWNGPSEGGSDPIEIIGRDVANGVWRGLNGDMSEFPDGVVIINSAANTEIEFEFTNDAAPNPRLVLYGKVTLSDPYAYSDVDSDANTAMSFWSLKDHSILPFRLDVWRSVGVRAEYHELTASSPEDAGSFCATLDDYRSPIGSPPYLSWNPMPWVDMRAYEWIFPSESDNQSTAAATELRLVYDGEVVGKPFTTVGIGFSAGIPDRNFSWGHKTSRSYNNIDTGCTHEIGWYGAAAGENMTGNDTTDTVIPKTASLWTEQEIAGNLYPGSFVMWRSASLFKQKQCEGVAKFPAYNLFGPYGFFRHDMDYGCCNSINSLSGSPDPSTGDTIQVEPDDDITDPGRTGGYVAAGDSVILFGGGITGYRIFIVADIPSALLIELGAEDLDARNVADAFLLWTEPIEVPTCLGVIGKLRDWKRSGASFTPPAILGKASAIITQDVSEPTKVLVTWVGTQKYTKIGDKIIFVKNDIDDTVNDDNSGAGYTVTDADDDSVKFVGTYNPSTMMGKVKILDAPLAKWNFVVPRGDFVWITNLNDSATGEFNPTPVNQDDRTNGVRKVLGCTPNGDLAAIESKTEVYPDGSGFPFPATPIPTTCGGKSLVLPLQFVRHPFVGAPFVCPGNPPMSICLPKVEAMTQSKMDDYVAAGAPALPDGCEFDIPPSVISTVGFSCDPPTLLPNGYPSPWNVGCTSSWTPP